MGYDVPLGFAVVSMEGSHYRISFPYGGHGGGDCEFMLPASKFAKFCEDEDWAWRTANKFFVLVNLGLPSLNASISSINAGRSGIVPENWE